MKRERKAKRIVEGVSVVLRGTPPADGKGQVVVSINGGPWVTRHMVGGYVTIDPNGDTIATVAGGGK